MSINISGYICLKKDIFTAAKQRIVEQANKALFALLKRSTTLGLPFDIQIQLFDKMVKPILLYGSELWVSVVAMSLRESILNS